MILQEEYIKSYEANYFQQSEIDVRVSERILRLYIYCTIEIVIYYLPLEDADISCHALKRMDYSVPL